MASVPLGEKSNGSLPGKSPDAGGAPAVEDWYFKVIGEELGPFTFDEVANFAEQGHLSATAEVKIGVSGTWTRVESVAQLVAVLPPEIPSLQISPPTSSSTAVDEPPPSPEAQSSNSPAALAPTEVEKSKAEPSSPQSSDLPVSGPSIETEKTTGETVAPQAKAPIAIQESAAVSAKVDREQAAELGLLKAQTAHTAIEQATSQLIACAFGESCEKAWWGWIGGVEYGPVEFAQLVEWVTAGRLRPNDFVRFGRQAQYTLVGSVPGLLHAASINNLATELLLLTISRVMPAKPGAEAPQMFPAAQLSTPVGLPLPPVIATSPPVGVTLPPKIVPTTTTPIPETVSPLDSKPSVPPIIRESQVTIPPVPQDSFPQVPKPVSTPGSRTIAPAKTSTKLRRSSKPSPLSLEMVLEKLKEPRIASGAVAILVSLLLLVAWLRSPPAASAADIGRYKELKKLLDDLRASRAANATDFSELKNRAEKLSKDFTPALTKELDIKFPGKQALLWAVQDELPKLMKQSLKTETREEKKFAQRLDEAKRLMRIRP